MVELN